MVWHAYQLNPRNFLEDCLRFGKLRLWRTGMPWNVINSCIKGNDLELIVSETTKKRFEGVIGEPWEMEDMPDTLEILCPGCANSNRVQWTEVNSAVMTHVSGVLDSGFASNHFRATCERCTMEITHIKLREANIRRRIVAAYKTSHPMPGTVLDLNGQSFRHLSYQADVNRCILLWWDNPAQESVERQLQIPQESQRRTFPEIKHN